jgi:hypothetical protein
MLPRVLATGNGAVERESGRGKEVPCSKAREKGSPSVNSDPRRKEVTIAGKSRANAIDAEQRDIGPADAAPPKHLIDLYQQSKNKGQHESHFITEPEAQKRDVTTRPGKYRTIA